MTARGILFDKDGTLFDFEATYGPACASVVRELAAGAEETAAGMAAAVGFDLVARRFLPDSIVIAGCAADMFELHTRETASLLDGIPATLQRLADAGLQLGLATNDAEVNARAHVEAAGLGSLLRFVAGYDSGHGAKPGPGMVQAFARHCGCLTGELVMVGDSVRDMAAARAAGAVAVAVTTGPASREELFPYADAVIDRLEELASLPWIRLTESVA